MSDRNLVTYVEPRNEFGPYWRLRIDRSANGQPGLFFTIETEMYDRDKYPHLHEELTVVVEDGNALLAPVLEWLNGG
jgi:hypothetical protein